jgi:uncharacterized protein
VKFDPAGKTALVTGASAGIGREIARLLAREVGTLVLVARRRERLDELAAELGRAHPDLRVLVRAVDLQNRDEAGAVLDALERDGIAIDLLVNNAGFGDYGLFEKSGWTKLEAMIELNVVSFTFLLHRLLPPMVGRGSGAVLNIGSTAGMFASPGVATYSATKAYVNLLSEAIRAEVAAAGVVVTVVCPGPVPTEFQEVAGSEGRLPVPKAFHIDAVQCAEESLAALKRGDARVITGAAMRAAMVSLESLPKVLVRPFLTRMARRSRGR